MWYTELNAGDKHVLVEICLWSFPLGCRFRHNIVKYRLRALGAVVVDVGICNIRGLGGVCIWQFCSSSSREGCETGRDLALAGGVADREIIIAKERVLRKG